VLGADHPETLHSVNNLAHMLDSRGDYAQAEALYRRALGGFERALGKERPTTVAARREHAHLMEKMAVGQRASFPA
jgi:hypothetical protein